MKKLKSFLKKLKVKVVKSVSKFEDWVAARLPRWKTKLTALLGFIGSAAAFLQDQITGLGLDPKTMAITGMVLFVLVYWFRRLGDR